MNSFSVQEKNQIRIVKCPKTITGVAGDELLKMLNSFLENPSTLFVLDMSDVQTLDHMAYRPVVLFYQKIKKIGSHLASVNVNREILQQIHAAGLDTVFSPRSSLDEAMLAAGLQVPRKTGIDVAFINPFIQATQDSLAIQASTKVSVGKPYLKKDGVVLDSDIAGVISLTSKSFNGSIALCFPKRVFLAIYSKMVGEELEEITRESEDAVGELLNIIFGQAKVVLNKEGHEIQRAIPAIVRGSQISVHHLSRNVAVILPFEMDSGKFHLEISTDLV